MNKIVVRNSSIVINDYSLGDCIPIEKFFSIYDKLTHKSYPYGLYYDEINRRLYLPRGIDIWLVEKYFNDQAYVERNMYTPFDVFDKEAMIKYLPRDDIQKKAIRFMIGKDEYRETLPKSQLSVNLNTGKGKTYCAIATICFLCVKSAIITYSKQVLEQWRHCILEYTDIKDKEIYTIDGSNCIYRLLSKSPDELKRIKVFLVTHNTLKSYGDHNGWNAVSELFSILRIGLKFFDEAHQNFENMLKIDYFTNVYKTYYITATPLRSDMKENKIYINSFKNVLAIDLFDENTDPHTKYIAIKYSSCPSPQIVSRFRNAYGLDRNMYMNWVATNTNFLKLCLVVMDFTFSKLATNPDDQVLVYIGNNQAILVFYNWFIQNFPNISTGIFSSVVSADKKAEALSKRVIISTTKSAGAAIDIRKLKVTIVLNEPFSSSVLARQTLGRTRNQNTYYIDIVDCGFRQCTQFFMKKKPVFNKYAEWCKVIELSNVDLNTRYNNIVKVNDGAQNAYIVPFIISQN